MVKLSLQREILSPLEAPFLCKLELAKISFMPKSLNC